MTHSGLTVGQAAEAAGLTRRAVRLYEAKGLLPPAERNAAGYRIYDEWDVEQLAFIRQARALGMHLDDIHQVLTVRWSGMLPCAAVRDLLDARIAEIDAAVDELLTLREALVGRRRSATAHQGETAAVCPIIEDTELA